MNKLTREAGAFAARVRMGSRRLWLIVEGKVHDPSFFDALLESHPGLEDAYSIRLAETIEIESVAAGGKSHSLALHDWFELNGLLVQESKDRTSVVAFALDRDFDHFSGDLVDSDHILYTQTMDVESEILLNGDLHAAASVAFSLTRETTRNVLPASMDLALDLADRWRDWIVLGACAMCCRVPTEVPFAKRSRINEGGFGAVVEDDAARFRQQVLDRLEAEQEVRFRDVKAKVEQEFGLGRQWMLVKGKWMAAFVWHLIGASLAETTREANVQAETLAKACIGTLDFRAPWARPYRERLDQLLAA